MDFEGITPDRLSPDGIYYHLTPASNLNKILKEGLKVGSKSFMSFDFEQGKSSRRIYLDYSYRTLVGNIDFQESVDPGWRAPKMVILSVRLPGDWPIYQDSESYELFTNKSIPSRYIESYSYIDL